MKQLKLIVYLSVFLSLTIIGVFWAIGYYHLDAQLQTSFHQLSNKTLLLLVLLYLMLYVTDIWRYQVLAKALGQRIRFLTGLEVSIANDFFSWITPGAALGAPAAIYVLGKKGMAWDIASIVCFGKSMIGSGVLIVAALLFLLFELGPPMPGELIALLIWGFSIVLLIILVPLLAATRLPQSLSFIAAIESRLDQARPPLAVVADWLKRLLNLFRLSVQRLAKLESTPRWIVAITLIHIPYLLVFAAMLVLLLGEFAASFSWKSVYGAIEYIAFTYVAPTPGAAGLSEASAAGFFSQLVSPAQALAAVLMFRACTIYLHIVVGLIYVSLKSGVIIVLRAKPAKVERQQA